MPRDFVGRPGGEVEPNTTGEGDKTVALGRYTWEVEAARWGEGVGRTRAECGARGTFVVVEANQTCSCEADLRGFLL